MSPLPEQAVDPAVTAHIRRQLTAGDCGQFRDRGQTHTQNKEKS